MPDDLSDFLNPISQPPPEPTDVAGALNAITVPPPEKYGPWVEGMRRRRKVNQIADEEMERYVGSPGRAPSAGWEALTGGKPSDVFRRRVQQEVPDLHPDDLQSASDAFDAAAPKAYHTKQFKDVLAQEKKEGLGAPAWTPSRAQAAVKEVARVSPFVPTGFAQEWQLGRAQDRMREGQETEADRRLIAQHMMDQQEESQRGVGEQIWHTASAMLAQLMELEAAGGLAKGVGGKIALQGLSMAPRKFSSGMMPGVQLDEQGNPVVGAQKSLVGEAGGAVAGGVLDAAVMHGVGQAGKALRGTPTGAVPGFLERAGVYGVPEGMAMGRAQEVVGGATGLRPDYGLTGELLSGDAERRKRALAEMGAEAAAFAIVGGIEGAHGYAGKLREALHDDITDGIKNDPRMLQDILFGGMGNRQPEPMDLSPSDLIGMQGAAAPQGRHAAMQAEPYTPPPGAPSTGVSSAARPAQAETSPDLRRGPDVPLTRATIAAEQLRRQLDGEPPASPEEIVQSFVSRPEARHLDAARKLMTQGFPNRAEIEEQLRAQGVNLENIARRVEMSGAKNAYQWHMWARDNKAFIGDDLKTEYAALLAHIKGQTGSIPEPSSRRPFEEAPSPSWQPMTPESTPYTPPPEAPRQPPETPPPGPAPRSNGTTRRSPASTPPEGTQGPSQAPQTPRQQADSLEQEHNALQARLLDVQATERRLLGEEGVGLNVGDQREAARQERLSIQKQLGGQGWVPGKAPRPESLMDRLDKARQDAAAAGGPPPPEPGTGIINPVPSGVPGIVSGAVEVPPEKTAKSPLSTGTSRGTGPRSTGVVRSAAPPATKEQAALDRQLLGALGDDTLHEWDAHDALNAARQKAGLGKVPEEDFGASLQRLHAAGKLDGGDVTDEHHAGLQQEADNLEASLRRAEARPAQEGRQPSRDEQHAAKEMRQAIDQLRAVAEAGPGRYWSRVPQEKAVGTDEAARAQIAAGKVVGTHATGTLPEEEGQEEPWVAPGGHGPAPEGEVEQELRELLQRRKAVLEARRANTEQLSAGGVVPSPVRYPGRSGILRPRTAPPVPAAGEAAEGNGGRTAPAAAGNQAGGDELTGRDWLDIRAEARRRLPFAEQEVGRQMALRRRLVGELRKFGNVVSDKRLDALSVRDRNAVKGLDDLAHSYAMNEPELFGSDGTEAADRIFAFLTGPKPEAPTFEELEARVAAEHLRTREARREEEAGRGDEPEGGLLPPAEEVAPGVLFHSSLRGAAKYEPVSREQAADILRSGRPTPQLTPGQRSLLEDHLLQGKSLNQIARERGFSSANASQTYNIALRNLGAPATARSDPRAKFTAGVRPGETPKTIDELKALLRSDEPIAGLSPREEVILRARLGPEPRSGAEVARELGVTRAAVSARFGIILKKLKVGGLTPETVAPEAEEGTGEVHLPERGELTTRKSAGSFDVAPGFTYEKATEEIADAYMRRLADKGNPITAKERAWFNSEMSRLSQEEVSGEGRGPALHDAYQRHRQAGEQPGVLYAPPAGTPAAPGGSGQGIDPFRIIATIKHLFGMPTYGGGEQALYDLNNESTTVPKMRAGEAPMVTHEMAHHLAKTLRLPLDPAQLPADVMTGLRQFDYVQGRQNQTVAAQEGFAEFIRRRETNQLYGLTPEQQAAADYAEKMLAGHRGVVEDLDRVKGLFDQLHQQSATQRVGGTISQTGKPATPVITAGEKAADFAARAAHAAADNLLDDAMPAKRAEAAVLSRGTRFLPGTRLSEVIATTRLRNVPDANEMQQGGVFGYDQDGVRKALGRPLAEILKDVPATDLPDLERLMHARRDVHDADTKGLKLPPEQLRDAREALVELAGDLPRFGRLSQAADAISKEVFDASLDAMVMSGRFDKEAIDKVKAENPFYVSARRVLDPEGKYYQPGRRKGEAPRSAGFLKQRTGESGEQRVGLMDAILDRYRFTASVLNDQAKFHALYDLSKREGVGQWLNPGVPGEGGEPQGWPRDGSKPTFTGYIDGKPFNVRINDRAMYELVTGTQGEGSKPHALFKAMGDVLQASRIPQMVRTGGTILSPLWHLKNFLRDPVLYVQRTVADKNPLQNLGDLAKWYGKSFDFYARALWAGGADRVEAKRATDVYFQLMERMAGRELAYGAESGQKTFTSRAMDGWHGLFQRVSDLLTAGEKGTRVLELKNVWDKLGWTQDRINAELAKDPSQRNPVPFAVQVAALDVASQITHNVHQQGVWVRQLNRSWPYLGAHLAGVYKDVQTYATQPKKAAAGLAILAAVKGLEWLLNKDDDDYKELPPYLRDGFVFKTPLGWLHFPAPRGLNAPVVGLMGEMLRATSQSEPRFDDLLAHSLGELGPQGGPEPIATGFRLAANRTWTDRPIIPTREADLMTTGERIRDPRSLAFAGSQLTGGMVDLDRIGAGDRGLRTLNPFGMDQHPHQSVSDYYTALHHAELAEQRRKQKATSGMNGGPPDPAYLRLKAAEQAMAALNKELKKHPEKEAEIRQRQVEVARHALGREPLKGAAHAPRTMRSTGVNRSGGGPRSTGVSFPHS